MALLDNVFINVSYSVQESWSFTGIMRTVKKEMSSSFDIITTTANWVKGILKARVFDNWKHYFQKDV